MSKRFVINTLLKSYEINIDISQQIKDTKNYRSIGAVGTLENHALEIIQGKEQQILLVEIDFDNSLEIEKLGEIINKRGSSLIVIVTSHDVRMEQVRMLMRMGVADYLPQPVLQEELLTVLDNAVARLGPTPVTHSGQGKVFTFMKASGGCGATTVALQAAYCLMGNHQKQEAKKVCYLDFDLQFGNAALFLDLDQKHSIKDVIENVERVDGDFLQGIMSKHSSGLYVLPAPQDIIPLEALTPQVAELIINIAAEEFDHVVIDLPMSWTMWTNTALFNSDNVNLVMQLSVKAIRQSKRILEMMASQGLDEQAVNIIANRFKKSLRTRGFIRKTEEALGHSINHFIANDYAIVSKSQDMGELIPMVKGRTAIEKQIKKLTLSSLREIDLRLRPPVGQS